MLPRASTLLRRVGEAAVVTVGVVAAEAIHVRRSFQLPPDPSRTFSGVEGPPATARLSSGAAGPAAARRHVVLLGDSLVTGVGCSEDASARGPVLPRSLAAVLAEGLGHDVSWTLLGETGADVTRLRAEYLPAFEREVGRLAEEGGRVDAVVVMCGLNDVKECCLHLQLHSRHPANFGSELAGLLVSIREIAGNQCTVLVPEEPIADNPRFSQLWPLSMCMRGVSALWDWYKQRACLQAASHFWYQQQGRQAQQQQAEGQPACVQHLPVPRPASDFTGEVYCSDGMHPNDLGYRLWGEMMGRALLDTMRRSAS